MSVQKLLRGCVASTLLVSAAVSSANAAEMSCNRACLERILVEYLNAVVAHNPAAAPLGAGYRQTENAEALAAGEGVWKSVTALGKTQRHYMDTETGSVGYYGTIQEGEHGSIATVRLLVENRKVIEAEWVIGRFDTGTPQANGVGSTSVEGADLTAPPVGSLPKAQRVPRRVMIAAANAYFDSVQSTSTQLMPSKPNYIRLENGVGTGEGPGGGRRGGGAGMYPGRAAAQAQNAIQGGPTAAGAAATRDICGGICNVAARRFPLVDEEAGVVLGIVVFQRPPANTTRRNLLSEWFTIESGRISGIYAAMHYLNPTTPAPNWPPYDGNFPLSFNVGIAPTPNAPAPSAAGPAAGAATQAPASRPIVPLTVEKLTDDVYWAKGPSTSNNSNNGFIIGRDGVMLLDTKNTVADEEALLAQIRQITDKKITHVLLTHGDGDHVNGLAALPRGLTIIAQDDCKRYMQANVANGRAAALADYLPTRTFTRQENLTIDGVPVQLYHFAPAHTGGDLILFLPRQRIVFMGDIIISEIPEPFMHMDNGGSPQGVIDSIKGMIELDADRYVSGHGPVIDKAELKRRLAAYEAKMSQVKALIGQGKTLAEIKQTLGESASERTPNGGTRPSFSDYIYQEVEKK